jgi:hypothetical protein
MWAGLLEVERSRVSWLHLTFEQIRPDPKIPGFFSTPANSVGCSITDPQLFDAATTIRIGQRDWKIVEAICSHGITAVEKSKMCESFGEQWATARVEGFIVGRGATKKVRVSWTNLKVPEKIEYGFGHSIFKDPSAQPRKKQPKSFISRR